MITPIIYWAYDEENTTLYISGEEIQEVYPYYDFFYGTIDTSDEVGTKHFDSEGQYVESGGDYYVPWRPYINIATSIVVSNITPWCMGEWFDQGENIENWIFENVDFSECTNYSFTFQYCKTIPEEYKTMVTTNTRRVSGIFWGFKGTELDVSLWNTSNITDMSYLFEENNFLESLDLSNWNTSNVTNMHSMFEECWNLITIDLSGFNTWKITTMDNMFKNCSALEKIYTSSKWYNNSNCSSVNMFLNCNLLKGAINYDSNKINNEYANYRTGYFTFKSVSYEPIKSEKYSISINPYNPQVCLGQDCINSEKYKGLVIGLGEKVPRDIIMNLGDSEVDIALSSILLDIGWDTIVEAGDEPINPYPSRDLYPANNLFPM